MSEQEPLGKHEVSDNPAHWKWGVFYYNPDDNRIFPPKRNPGLGYTINFAKKRSVLVLLAIVSIPLIIEGLIALARSLKH